ncbi:hypothetical protein ISS85_02750 [Candidatus Microgenomates bacterium]|nr:hypothetical protein [Candidatus Microgenomates bacterium]
MDFVSHSLWGLTVVRKKNLFWLTVFFSVLPDIAYFLYFLDKRFSLGIGVTEPSLVSFYYFTHSFLTAFLIFTILYFFKRNYLTLALPYFFHVLLDIPVHCGLFSTRFLYPFSDFHFCGFRFEEHMLPILLINYLVLIGINLLIWRRK